MKKRFLLIIVPIIIGVLGFSLLKHEPNAEDSLTTQRFAVEASKYEGLEFDQAKKILLKDVLFFHLFRYHFNQFEIDDAYSKKAFDMYMKRLDVGKVFLLKEDYDCLKKYELTIDNEINENKESLLLKEAISIIEERTKQVEVVCNEILEKPFDLQRQDKFETDVDKRQYADDLEGLKNRWRMSLKYQCINRLHLKMESQESEKKAAEEKGESFEGRSLDSLEYDVRKDLKKNYKNYFERLGQIDSDDRMADYFNALVGVYCPHTEYFPPQEKENFDIDMSGQLEGIGAQLSQRDGEIKVVKIIPGSASWRQKELEAGDKILKVGQAEEEPVSVAGMPLKDAVSLIRGKKGTEVRLTVKKKDGVLKVIPIIRDVVILEESYAKSAIIYNKELKKKIGYILLPSFYADFQRNGGRNSGEDIRIELEKLKEAGAEGVVFDLRHNGGGSLQDAINMSGWFVKKGPVVQVKDRIQPSMVYEDQNRSLVFDGPLAIMTSKLSASASEILAGALQDYERAIVIGSEQSFGKGTVQRFVDLDMVVPPNLAKYKPLGSLKLTIQKFYRISGKSTQEKGVEADIVLPDAYKYLDIGERELDYALPYDEIASANYLKFSDKSFVKEDLQKKSMKRLKKDEMFKLVEENALRLKKQKDDSKVNLGFTNYRAEQKMLKEQSEKFNNLKREHTDLEITAMDSLVKKEITDSTMLKVKEDWVKGLKEDIYIYEATNVVADWLDAEK